MRKFIKYLIAKYGWKQTTEQIRKAAINELKRRGVDVSKYD